MIELTAGELIAKATPKPSRKAAPKTAPGSKADKAAPEPGSEEGIPRRRLVSILGREVTNRDGDHGRVIDVLIDLDGGSGAVVVEFGGFMGIGSRKVAVEWKALHFVRDRDRSSLIIDIGREQIRDTPEYMPDAPPVVLTRETAKPAKAKTTRPAE